MGRRMGSKSQSVRRARPNETAHVIVQMRNEEFAELFHTGMLDPVLVSLTFGKRGGNLPPRVIERFGAILRTWAAKDIFEEGMATTERGDENMRKHVQGMVVMLINNTMDMSTCGTHRTTYVQWLL